MDNIKYGYSFPLGNKEVFVETSAKRRTASLASKILCKLQLPDNPATRADLLYYLKKMTLEQGTLSYGTVYYKYSGERYAGTCFEDDIIIINI